MPTISLNRIQIDETIYPRSGVSDFNVNRLIAALRTGTKLPPLIVEAKTYRLVDGRHRYDAYKHEGIERCEVETKVYTSEADLFADAVRYNVGHGEPLDGYCVRAAIIRLTEYGYQKDQISDVVRLPVDQIEKIERGFAHDAASGKPLALKGGLSHLAGATLDGAQQIVNRNYSGAKAVFYVRQICALLENDMWPRSQTFSREMDRLTDLWMQLKAQEAA